MPVQVQCTMLDAWGWCTGTTQRDGMGREEGGGFRMGNTCFKIIKFKNKKKRKRKVTESLPNMFNKHYPLTNGEGNGNPL